MEAVNFTKHILQKGLNTNIDNIRYPADSAFEILNGRIYSSDGENFVVKNVDGNQFKFALKSGYTLIGAQEYDEILYLVSVNDDNMVEVGTYPSLKKQMPISAYNGYIRYGISNDVGFENEYKPLPSIWRSEEPELLPQVYGFRTKSFKFSRDNFIMPLIKESYDGTVNIYLNDGENFNRVVNSGFSKKDEEVKLERLYRGDVDNFDSIDKNVDKVTKQFLSINEPPYGKLKEVASGGNLPVGNLFFYIRYLDYEFNKTNFVPLIGPIMITYGDDIFSVSGNHPTGLTNYANKNVTISMEYIDKAYKYFEIAMVWKTGTEPVGLGSRAMLLNKRIPILETSFDFNLTGFEDMAEITEDEVLRPALKETISKVSVSLDGRFFGANWKEFGYNKDAMRELAKRCYVFPELVHRNSLIDLNGDPMNDYSMRDIDVNGPGAINKKYWYQQTEFVIDRLGHYRGEIYPFSLVGVLEDGTYTDPFPITGYDFYSNPTFHPTENYLSNPDNTNCGFVRFPQFGQCDLGDNVDDINQILLARIGLGFFWEYIRDNRDSFNGLKGFYITKGDRIKNLIYHGITLRAAEIFAKQYGSYDFLGQQSTREIDVIGNKIAVSVPVTDTFPRRYDYSTPPLPVGKSKNGSIPIVVDYESSNTGLWFGSVWSQRNRHGVFSPDRLFSNIDKFVNSESLYCYFPYTQLPKFGLNSYSNYATNSYVVPGTDSHFFLNNIYQMRYDYQEGFMGRMSINGNLVRGYFNTIQSTFHKEYKTYGYWEKTDYAWPTKEVRVGLINDYYKESPYIPFIPSDLTKQNDYIKVSGTNVLKDMFRSINNYSTKLGDGIYDNVDVGFYDNDTVDIVGNRDIRIVPYLGIDYTDDESSYLNTLFNDATMMPITIYREKNDAAYYNKVVSRYRIGDTYQLSEINYKISTPFIPIVRESRTWSLNEKNASLKSFNWVYSNGDCFISRVTFRQMYNGKTFDIYNSKTAIVHDPDGKHYNHGRIFSVVLQSDVNTGVRGQGALGFYPLWASDWKKATSSDNYNSMLCSRFAGSGGVDGEDFIYDWGHSQSLPLNIIPGINDIYQNRNTDYITRVRYTDKHQEVAFIDGWRSMFYLSKADFPVEYGEIFGIGVIGSSLVIATPDSVQQLFVNEKAITQSEQGGNVIVGAGSILYGQSKRLSDYGTQHKHILTTDNGVYGYDYKRSIFWRVIASSTTSGGIALGVRPISSNISSSLIKRRIDDSSIKSIAYGYDEAEHEVLMTVKHKIRLSVNQFSIADNGNITMQLPLNYDNYDWCGYVEVERNGRVSNVSIVDLFENILTLSNFDVSGTIVLILNKGFTLSYNELLSSGENDFITRLGISPDIYSSLKNVVMSLNRDISYDYIYSHDNISEKHTFYGYNSWFKYGIVVNNGSAQATHTQTIFYSFIVTSNEEPFDVIDYETEFQRCRNNPFIDNVRFWLTPNYKENRWDFTIPTSEVTMSGYLPDSNMRGIWLKTLLIYKGKNNKYIGEIINKNVLSFA